MILNYIDPGSGSMLVQILVVFFATISVFFKSIRNTISNLCSRKNKNTEDESSIDD